MNIAQDENIGCAIAIAIAIVIVAFCYGPLGVLLIILGLIAVGLITKGGK